MLKIAVVRVNLKINLNKVGLCNNLPYLQSSESEEYYE